MATPRVEYILQPHKAAQASETRRRVLVQAEVRASSEEGNVNVRAIDPAYGARRGTIARGVAVAKADGDCHQPMPGL